MSAWDGIFKVKSTSSGGPGAGDSFTTIDVPAGTDPVASSPTSTLTFTSSDSSVTITGNSATDTIDFVAAGGTPALPDSQIFVGNASNVATAVAMSSGATISNTGAVTLGNTAVTGQALTGLAGGTTAIAAADTILQAMGKAVASSATSTTDNYLVRFDGTSGKLIQPPTGAVTLSDANVIDVTASGAFSMGTNTGLVMSSSVPAIRNAGTVTATFGSQNPIFTGGSAQLELGNSNSGATSIIQVPSSTSGTVASSLRIQVGAGGGSGAGSGGNLDLWGGGTSSSSTSSLPGIATVRGGFNSHASKAATGGISTLLGGPVTNAGNSSAGGNAVVEGGAAAGSGAGGNAVIQGGTSGSGSAGVVQIGRSSTTNKNILNNATAATGAVSLTMTNGPTGTTGNPGIYIRLTINGTDYVIPGWAI
jgi:trimeric autotransporter adhesin